MDRPVASQPPSPRTRATRVGIGVAFAAWCVAVAIGFVQLFGYANEPGAVDQVPTVWPVDAPDVLAPTRPTLLVFVHPLCPCSRASLAELARIVARTGDRLAVHVFFGMVPGLDARDLDDDLPQVAAAIPEVVCHADPRGTVAARFGARTSGFAVLYRPDGSLAFAGGVTASRGHEGDNRGADAVVACAFDSDRLPQRTAVFGCSLFDPERAPVR